MYDGSAMPAGLGGRGVEFLNDLKSALIAYEGAGVYSADYSSYDVTLDMGAACALHRNPRTRATNSSLQELAPRLDTSSL